MLTPTLIAECSAVSLPGILCVDDEHKNPILLDEAVSITRHQFFGIMNDELRTLMNSVLVGMAKLLEMTDLTEEQREYVKDLNLSGKNLLTLVNDMLKLQSIETGKIDVKSTVFNLNQYIDDTAMMQ